MTARLPQPQAVTSSSSQTAAAAVPMDVLVDYGVSADVSLTQGESGTKVGYVCRYEDREDYSGGHAYRYNLVAFTRSGETETVASWWAEPGKSVADDTWTAVNLDDITKVELQNDHGKAILRLKL